MFDLPVLTDRERKDATRFRNNLLDDGYLMIQFSVYARPCVSYEHLEKHLAKVQVFVPEAGNVRIMFMTDEQWKKSVNKVDPILRPGKRKVKLAWSRAWM